jgi:ABC-2 type transport system ATP-binding protein
LIERPAAPIASLSLQLHAMIGAMIELKDLTKVYGRTKAVCDLTCSIEPGAVTGFLGPNGAGKSTTMRLIVGLDHPTAGSATIGGQRYEELKDPLRTVGALLDCRQVHPNRSARAHLHWIARSNRLPVTRVDEVLDTVGLTPAADSRAGAFSLGMLQRLGIAVALLGDPSVLLFDEPMNGLDPEGIRWVRALMRELADEGRTVFVSSHLLSEVANTADHLVILGRGTLIKATTMSDFLSESGAIVVRVRSPQLDALSDALSSAGLQINDQPGVDGAPGTLLVRGTTIEDVGELAARNGVILHELSSQQDSLEEAYMKLTDAVVEYRAVTQ